MYVTTKQFYERLMNHDYWSMMSDDNRVYEAGRKDWREINEIACSYPKFSKMFSEFMDWREGRRDRPLLEEYIDDEDTMEKVYVD